MSQKESTRRKMARAVFLQAWKYIKRSGIRTFSLALKLAWRTIRSLAHFSYSKVRGVSFANRQVLLKKLAGYELPFHQRAGQAEGDRPLPGADGLGWQDPPALRPLHRDPEGHPGALPGGIHHHHYAADDVPPG